MKETPEEFLNRLTETIDSEVTYIRALYGRMVDIDPDDTDFPDLPYSAEDYESPLIEEDEEPGYTRTRLDLPDEILNSWRADCPRFPYEPPCDLCIYEHCNSHNYFIGGHAHGKEVPRDLILHRTIRVPSFRAPVGFFGSSNMCVEEEVIRNEETYIKRTINVVLERGYSAIAIWVLESITDSNEAFQKFYKFAQRGE